MNDEALDLATDIKAQLHGLKGRGKKKHKLKAVIKGQYRFFLKKYYFSRFKLGHTVVPQRPWRIGSRDPLDTKFC